MPPPKRVVYLTESHYSRRDHERFGVETLERRGVAVEVWDMTLALHPRLAAEELRPPDPFFWRGLRSIAGRREALAAVRSLSRSDFAICLLGYEPASWDVFRALSLSSARYGCLSGSGLPPAVARREKLTVGRAATALYMRTPMKFLGHRQADIVFYSGGERSRRRSRPLGPSTEEVWAHALDYDHLLARGKASGPGGTAVFLDEYMPFHSDYARLRLKPHTTAERYYPPLRAFFDRFERETGLKVVVAAHPRSRYEDHPDFFGGRPVQRDRTVEQIAESGAVIAHASTAVGLAVLFGKPVVFATSADLRASMEGPFIESFAAILGKEPIDLDAPRGADWASELKIDFPRYAEYLRLYIKKPGTPELPFWEIVADHLGIKR